MIIIAESSCYVVKLHRHLGNAALADIISGVTKGRRLPENDIVTVPYMRVANVQDGRIVLDEIKEIPATQQEVMEYRL